MSLGKETYNVDSGDVRARGLVIDEPELKLLLCGPVKKIINDTQGKQELRVLLTSVVSTGFETTQLDLLLEENLDVPDWYVGEALAELLATLEKDCVFPWPSSRDLKNQNSSATGADLVGFQKTGDEETPYRFAFGEVKTSTELKWPPQVVYGRGGLKEQIEGLTHSFPVKQGLFLYLGMHALKSDWLHMYQSAAKRYLKSGFCDSSLFGILIRDVEPKSLDIKHRAFSSAQNKPILTEINYYAVYLPPGKIPELPSLLTSKEEP